MATKIYKQGGMINIEGVHTNTISINPAQYDWSQDGSNYNVRDKIDNQTYALGAVGDIQNKAGVAYATENDVIRILNSLSSLDTNLQDQTTKPVILKFNRVTNTTTLAATGAIDDTTITVASATGIAVGSYIILFNPTSEKFMFATVTSIAGSPVITLDTPLDFAYPIGTNVDVGITDFSTANGTLATPITFGLRGTGAPPGVDVTVDITRLIFTCVTTSAVDLTKFCNFAKLINGLVLRRRDGNYENILNIKDNAEIAGLMYDFTVYAATNPVQGVDGFVSRITFSGQEKIGVAIRLPVGDDLEFLIQDDLLTPQATETITRLEVIAEGHIVEQ